MDCKTVNASIVTRIKAQLFDSMSRTDLLRSQLSQYKQRLLDKEQHLKVRRPVNEGWMDIFEVSCKVHSMKKLLSFYTKVLVSQFSAGAADPGDFLIKWKENEYIEDGRDIHSRVHVPLDVQVILSELISSGTDVTLYGFDHHAGNFRILNILAHYSVFAAIVDKTQNELIDDIKKLSNSLGQLSTITNQTHETKVIEEMRNITDQIQDINLSIDREIETQRELRRQLNGLI